MLNLIERHRPTRLCDVYGQTKVCLQMHNWLADPYSTAMLLVGATGTGKTTIAHILAAELNCGIGDLAGVFECPSGEQDAESVRDIQRKLQFHPMTGSGWRVVICNECDQMTHKAATMTHGSVQYPARDTGAFGGKIMSETTENLAYAKTFAAIELIAATRHINMDGLHHRYTADTACRLMRTEAARLLHAARAHDRTVANKVHARHRPQV